MRLSVYKPNIWNTYSRVLLNGEELRDFVTADEEACEVEVLMRDDFGNFVLGDNGREIQKKKLRGIVKIITLPLNP